ncbi:MAG: hypothetical protein GY765_00130 [bacterium]|nr:hypothetical protein [bacterium]
MDLLLIAGLFFAMFGTFGFFKKEKKKETTATITVQKAADFLKPVRKLTQISHINVTDFLFTVNIYKIKKNQLLGIAIANARRSTLVVNDVLIETKKNKKPVYTKLPGTGFNDNIFFEVESGKVMILASPLDLFVETLNTLENEDAFFTIVVIDSSSKKFKSGKMTIKKNSLSAFL